jgi:hypothetical protein
LVAILFDVGPVKPMPMSAPVAIEEIDLLAYQVNRGMSLTPWEAGIIRELSREYAAMLSQASAANCPPPYFSPKGLDDERRQKIAQGMSDFANKLNASRGV